MASLEVVAKSLSMHDKITRLLRQRHDSSCGAREGVSCKRQARRREAPFRDRQTRLRRIYSERGVILYVGKPER